MMINNPFTDKSLAEIQSCFTDRNTEKVLADAYAVTDDWAALMDVYQSRIFAILIKEEIRIPETAQIHVLLPFMEQNGYIFHSGWWYPENE